MKRSINGTRSDLKMKRNWNETFRIGLNGTSSTYGVQNCNNVVWVLLKVNPDATCHVGWFNYESFGGLVVAATSDPPGVLDVYRLRYPNRGVVFIL